MSVEKKQTGVVRLGGPEDLSRILSELGVRPSDVFFSDGVVFVEGPTDRIVLPRFASLIGIDFKELDLSIIPIFGASSGNYHLKIWTDASQSAQIPFFMVLDKGADSQAAKYVSDGVLKPNENLFILKKGSIEDYYPPSKLAKALEEEFEITLDENEKAELAKTPRVDLMEKILRAKGKDPKRWKVSIGRRVANLMTADEVDDELRSILERIRSRVETLYMGK